MKKLGILGGLGPMATAYFLQLLTQMSDAQTDQEHMEILLYSKPSIPDRTSYIIGKSNRNPVEDMAAAGKKLKEMGADLLAIPCITAHFFHRELEERIGLPILHAIEETAIYLEEEEAIGVGVHLTEAKNAEVGISLAGKIAGKADSSSADKIAGKADPFSASEFVGKADSSPAGEFADRTNPFPVDKKAAKVGILATDGTIQSGLFQNTLKEHGMQPLVPGTENQKKLMGIIYNEIKCGKAINMPRFHQAAKELFDQGAEVVLLACTELSLIKKDYDLPTGYLDVMEVLARKAVLSCNRLKAEYVRLH